MNEGQTKDEEDLRARDQCDLYSTRNGTSLRLYGVNLRRLQYSTGTYGTVHGSLEAVRVQVPVATGAFQEGFK